MASAHDQAASSLDAHERSIEELHRKLAATPGVDAERLKGAVAKYVAAHRQFRDDALGCMN
jgi:hypothetical protein